MIYIRNPKGQLIGFECDALERTTAKIFNVKIYYYLG